MRSLRRRVPVPFIQGMGGAIAGRPLSQSAEEGWYARAAQVIDQISSTGDNTV